MNQANPKLQPLEARLAIIGAYPERQLAFPFGDYAGELLFRLLPLARENCYVDYVCPTYQAGRKFMSLREVGQYLPALKERLERVDANCFLALGPQALFALTGKDSIDKYRGSILESTLLPGKKVAVAWDPHQIIKGQYERRFILEADLRKACQAATSPTISKRDFKFTLDPTYDEFEAFVKNLGEDVSVDIECPIRAKRIIYCIGLSSDSSSACCLPLVGGTKQTPRDLMLSIRLLQNEVFARRGIIGQNIGFDTDKLEALGFRLAQIKFDTMLAHHLLWPEAGTKQKDEQGKDNFAGGHDLGFLVSVYTDQPYHKDLGKNWTEWSQLWHYNCLDAALTYEIYLRELEELIEFNQLDYYNEHVMGLLRPVMRMQQRGLRVDNSKLGYVQKRIDLERQYIQARLNQRVGFDLNVKSPQQKRYLIDSLGMKSVKRTKKGAASTDEETLRTLAYSDNEHADIFNDIIEVTKRRTLQSGFLNMETGEDGRYRAMYKIHGTDSGRLSCLSGKNIDGNKGPQLQNIPKKTRVLFIPEPGKIYIQRDLSRAEAMYVAYDAQDTKLIELFENKIDPYIYYGSHVLGSPVEKGTIERECFKTFAHSANYGVGPRRCIGTLRLKGINIEDITIRGISTPTKKGQYILEGYYALFSGIRPWQQETIARAKTDRVLYDIFGRRRFFMGDFKDTHTHRVILSYKPQASITGITNRAIRILDAYGYPIVLQVHDSLALEVLFENFDRAWTDSEEALRYPITLHNKTFTIPCDGAWGFSWGELNESRVLASELPKLYREARGS